MLSFPIYCNCSELPDPTERIPTLNTIIFDLEWNQCPYGKDKELRSLPFEIIEIGAVKLDDNRQEIGRFSCLVRPVVYKQLHFRTREILHVDIDELADAPKFPQAMKKFLDFCGEDPVFCTWGDMDLMELQRNLAFHRMKSPFPQPLLFYDIQKLYSLLYEDGKARSSLESAVNFLGLAEPDAFHRALDDAVCTAKIFQTMDFPAVSKYLSVDYFRPPAAKEEEVFLDFGSYTKFVSRTFPTKEMLMADKQLTSIVCNKCNRRLRKKIFWFPGSQKAYFALAWCPEHGFVKGKIRIKKAAPNCYFAVKTVKHVDEDGANTIIARKEILRFHRKQKRKKPTP